MLELKKIKEDEMEDLEEIETFDYSDSILVNNLIGIDYLPKDKSPINNLFLISPLFTPCSRNIKTQDLYRKIKIENQFGYSVEVSGARLNMSVDFPIWSHIVRLVMEQKTSSINMNYIDFAKILGYNRKNLGSKLRDRIFESLVRLKSQTITLENEDEDIIMGLLDNAYIMKKNKEVIIKVNKEILKYYKKDRFKLIDLNYYNDLQNEITKALYLYYENHKGIIYPIKFTNIKDRMNLVTKNDKEINRQIKIGHENLIEKGYLKKYNYLKRNNIKYIEVKK